MAQIFVLLYSFADTLGNGAHFDVVLEQIQ
jgi:hypothetical protein